MNDAIKIIIVCVFHKFRDTAKLNMPPPLPVSTLGNMRDDTRDDTVNDIDTYAPMRVLPVFEPVIQSSIRREMGWQPFRVRKAKRYTRTWFLLI